MLSFPFLFDRVFSYDSVTKYFMRKVNLGFPFYMKTCRQRFQEINYPGLPGSGLSRGGTAIELKQLSQRSWLLDGLGIWH